MATKKGRDNFIELVDKCKLRDMTTTNMVRKFSKRARGYMVAYHALESDEMKDNDQPTEFSHQMIEKMKKL